MNFCGSEVGFAYAARVNHPIASPDPVREPPAEDDSPRPVRKAMIAFLIALVGAVPGFLLGFAPDDNKDYRKRAADCAELLHKVAYGAVFLDHDAFLASHLPDSDPKMASLFQYINNFQSQVTAVDAKCPMSGNSEYLKRKDIKNYLDSAHALFTCTSQLLTKSPNPDCSKKYWVKEQHDDLLKSAKALEQQADLVSRWSPTKQAVETAWRYFDY